MERLESGCPFFCLFKRSKGLHWGDLATVCSSQSLGSHAPFLRPVPPARAASPSGPPRPAGLRPGSQLGVTVCGGSMFTWLLSKPFWDPILGVFGAPPILEPVLVGMGIFAGGYGIWMFIPVILLSRKPPKTREKTWRFGIPKLTRWPFGGSFEARYPVPGCGKPKNDHHC